ncbi:hypothetical protein FRB99_005948 [Tulasnella sp. 403]|nr:hypothetical protein FRB99_005948 [Tulasnella sp. 403]
MTVAAPFIVLAIVLAILLLGFIGWMFCGKGCQRFQCLWAAVARLFTRKTLAPTSERKIMGTMVVKAQDDLEKNGAGSPSNNLGAEDMKPGMDSEESSLSDVPRLPMIPEEGPGNAASRS